MKTGDARGLSCPEPVVQVQNAFKTVAADEKIEVLVDTVTSRENVSRMAAFKGWQVEIEETADGFRLILSR